MQQYAATPTPETNNIRSLILEKEKELHDINEYRIRTLEGLLKEKEQAMQGYKQKFYQLQEDFKYNLKLLEGRDEELAMYDSNFATLKIVVRDRESDVSELKIQLADVQSDLKMEKQKASEGDMYMQQKLKEVRGAMESTRWSYDEDMRKAKEEVESMKRRYERELREKDEDIESIRRELTVTFDDVLRQREQEFRAAHDDVGGKARDLELKVKSIGRENDTLKERNHELRRKVDELAEQLSDSDKAQKGLQWEVADVRALNQAKIAQLEQETMDLQAVKQALLDEYEAKMADLLQSLHAVEKAFLAQKAQFHDDLKRAEKTSEDELNAHTAKMEARIQAVVAKLRVADEALEKVQTECKQAKWEAQDQLLQRERDMDRLTSDHEDALNQRDAMLKQLKHDMWQVEMELKTSRESARTSVQLIQDGKETEATLRRDLQLAHDTIDELKRHVHTTSLSLEVKLQEAEHEWTARHNVRMREVAAAKERMSAEKQAAEDRLKHAEAELTRVRGELYAQKALVKANEAFSLPSVPSQVSPVWSDAGSLPPALLSMQSPATSPATPPPHDHSNDHHQYHVVAAENAKLKGMIRTMTEELMKQSAALPSPTSPPPRSQANVQATTIGQLESQIQDLHVQVDTLQKELLAARTNQTTTANNNTFVDTTANCTTTNQEGVIADLRKQLADALAQVDVLKAERNALMELSNQLTAENRKLQLGTDSSLALKQQEGRVAELTHALDEARGHNKALKKELRRWLKREDAASPTSSIAAPHQTCDTVVMSLQAAKRQVEAARATSSFTDTTTTTSTSSPPTTTMSDARLKLKHAKEVLALAGKKVEDLPGGRPMRAPSLVHRETDSQRSVMSKLKELQSKRAEMAQERKKVRNYSIPSS
ncbi:hypothetical protein H257_05445 [Aphanomyces astaci]|uniref:Uncharacterized protein n=1 Tax=Aphanomyces astaci TaxID=112090 RepID=W4GRD3_APHAT|nr:hypothetical protein H257_05445 [Aphanomyces astaci]ETV81901.1 hypothetical protein H257_05445 [Aphanomyces astaci]|eukprot:XP_009828638.1 hypothetical protein H257_05445 [Aphanomyces astaci]